MSLVAHVKQVEVAHSQLFILARRNARSLVDERTFAPSSWGDDDGVDYRGEILDQMCCFRLSVGEVFVGGNFAKDEGSFHIVQIYGKCNYKKCNYKKCNHKKCKKYIVGWGRSRLQCCVSSAAMRLSQPIGPIGLIGPIHPPPLPQKFKK